VEWLLLATGNADIDSDKGQRDTAISAAVKEEKMLMRFM
jgi:hypothetical protein